MVSRRTVRVSQKMAEGGDGQGQNGPDTLRKHLSLALKRLWHGRLAAFDRYRLSSNWWFGGQGWGFPFTPYKNQGFIQIHKPLKSACNCKFAAAHSSQSSCNYPSMFGIRHDIEFNYNPVWKDKLVGCLPLARNAKAIEIQGKHNFNSIGLHVLNCK